MQSRKLLIAAVLVTAASGCHDITSSSGSAAPPPSSVATRATNVEGYASPGPRGTGWIIGRTGDPTEVSYEVHDGQAVIEGDIVVGLVSRIAATRNELLAQLGGSGARKGVVINQAGSRWPGGDIPYVISSSLPAQYRVTDAMAHIQSNHPTIHFVPRTTQSDYILIQPAEGCSSYVGRVGGAQPLSLASDCSTGNAIHELLHAIGMYHEQSRCDRDSYVEVLWQNIIPGLESQFYAQCSGAVDLYSYAEGSVMHYPPTAFSVNGLQTLRSRRGLDSQMGQRSGEAPTDIWSVNAMYPAPVTPTLSATIVGPDEMSQNEIVQYTAEVANGSGGYTYQWSQFASGTDPYLTIFGATQSDYLVLDVWDSAGHHITAQKYITVNRW